MRRLSAFFELPAGDQRRVIEAGLLVVAFRLGLWIVPYRHLKRMVDRVPRRNCAAEDHRLAQVIRNVVSIAQFVPSASCLTQALATQVLLKREGFDPRLQIGVARDAGGVFKAHAWVECGGTIVVGDFSNTIQYVKMNQVAPSAA